ncbi:hypothetical protein pb186bvf_007858 [Paramecium bursaria]
MRSFQNYEIPMYQSIPYQMVGVQYYPFAMPQPSESNNQSIYGDKIILQSQSSHSNQQATNQQIPIATQQHSFISMKKKPIEDCTAQKQNSASTRKFWTQEEDNTLKELVQQQGSNWLQIASKIPGRNASQCAQRWKRIKPADNERNQKWTAEEDEKVLRLSKVYKQNWKKIADQMGNRTGRQIRERYINHLDPEINNKKWSQAEDRQIWKMYQNLGTKWSEMAKQLKGRPENMIKNRFYSFIRKKYGKIENPYYVIQEVKNEIKVEQEGVPIMQMLPQVQMDSIKPMPSQFEMDSIKQDSLKGNIMDSFNMMMFPSMGQQMSIQEDYFKRSLFSHFGMDYRPEYQSIHEEQNHGFLFSPNVQYVPLQMRQDIEEINKQ